jgi:hypothetical protein
MRETLSPDLETDLGFAKPKTEYGPQFTNALHALSEKLMEKAMNDPDDEDGSKPGYIYDTPNEILKVGDKNYDRYMCRVGLINGLMLNISNILYSPSSPLEQDEIDALKFYESELRKIATTDPSGKKRTAGGILKLTKEEVLKVKYWLSKTVDTINSAIHHDSESQNTEKPKTMSAAA